jgi:hypothetical protein
MEALLEEIKAAVMKSGNADEKYNTKLEAAVDHLLRSQFRGVREAAMAAFIKEIEDRITPPSEEVKRPPMRGSMAWRARRKEA